MPVHFVVPPAAEPNVTSAWVSWVKTKIQAFNDILDAAILSVPVCGEDVEVAERFTYLGSDIHICWL